MLLRMGVKLQTGGTEVYLDVTGRKEYTTGEKLRNLPNIIT
jgi:hypothetical protein